MKNSDVRKHRSATARTDRAGRRNVTGRYWAFKLERPLRLILLSSTIGVLGACAFAGTAGGSLDSAGNAARQTRAMASQSVDQCLEWGIACLLERPVGTVSGGFPPGPGDRGHEGDDGGADDGGSVDGGADDGGTDDGGTDDGGADDGGTDDGGTDDGGTDDGGTDDGGGGGGRGGGNNNNGLGNGDENNDSSANGSGNTDSDNPGKGGGAKGGGGNGGGNGHGGSER